MTFPNKAMSEISIPFGFALQFKIYEARLKILGLRITQVVTKYRLVDSSDTNLYDMQTVNPPAGEPSLKHDTLYTVMATEPFPQADFYHGSKVDVVMTVMVTNGTDTVSYESVMPDIVLVTTNVIDLDLPIDHPVAIPKHVNDVLVANLFATGNVFTRIDETTTLNDNLYTHDDTIYDLVNFTRLSNFDITLQKRGYYLIDCTMLLRKTSEHTDGGVSHQLTLNVLQSDDGGTTWTTLRTKVFSTLEDELNQGLTLGTTNSAYFVFEKTTDFTVQTILRPEIKLESTDNVNWGWATFGYIMKDYSHMRALELKPDTKVLNMYANIDIVSTDAYQVLPWDESELLNSSNEVYSVANDAITISEQGCYLVVMNLGIVRRTDTHTDVDQYYLVNFAVHKNGAPITKSERGVGINKYIGTTVSSIFVDCFEVDDVIDARVSATAGVDVDFKDSMSDLIVLKIDEEFSNVSQMTVTNQMILDATHTVDNPMMIEWTQDPHVSSEFYELLTSTKVVKCNAHGKHRIMLSLGPELTSDRNSMSIVYLIYKNGVECARLSASSRSSYHPSCIMAEVDLRYADQISVGMYYIHHSMYDSALPCNVRADCTMVLMCDSARLGPNIVISMGSAVATDGSLTLNEIAVNTYTSKASEKFFDKIWMFGMLNSGATMTNSELEQLADSIDATTASCEYVSGGSLPYHKDRVVLTEAFEDSTLATSAVVSSANDYDAYTLCYQVYDKSIIVIQQNPTFSFTPAVFEHPAGGFTATETQLTLVKMGTIARYFPTGVLRLAENDVYHYEQYINNVHQSLGVGFGVSMDDTNLNNFMAYVWRKESTDWILHNHNSSTWEVLTTAGNYSNANGSLNFVKLTVVNRVMDVGTMYNGSMKKDILVEMYTSSTARSAGTSPKVWQYASKLASSTYVDACIEQLQEDTISICFTNNDTASDRDTQMLFENLQWISGPTVTDTVLDVQKVFHVEISTPSETISRTWQQGMTDISGPDPDPGSGPAPPPAVVDFYGDKSLGDLTVNSELLTMNKFSGIVPNVTSSYIANSVMIDLVNVAAFAVNDLILLIQVQGIDNYGQWELNRIIDITGSVATLNKPLKYTYTYEDESTALRYQVVKVPQYNHLTIDTGGVVSSAAYDGVDGGGVLAIAAETLTINGGVLTMSGKGYRGAYNNRPRNQNLWASEHMAGHNGSVGEGYAGKYVENWLQFAHNDTANHYMYSTSTNYGGGAGGGGGTLGSGWSGITGGRGGDHNHASSDINVKLTMGGGGGGGGTHDIEGLVDAGEGGGIILLIANHINFLGGSMETKGTDGVYSTVVFHGGHGGGAGGSVHIFANSSTGASTTLNLSGGLGSTVTSSGGHQNVGDVNGKPGSSGVVNALTNLNEPPILSGGNYKYTTNTWEESMLYKKYNILTRNDQRMLASEVSSDLVVSYSGGMFGGWDKLPGIFMDHDARYLTAGDFPRVADTEIVIDLSWGTGDAWDAGQGYFVAEFGINRGNTARYKPNLTISDESGNNAISFSLPQPTGVYEIFKVNKVYKRMKIAINGTNYNDYHYVYKIGVYGKTDPVTAFDMSKASAYTGGIASDWPVTYVNGVQRLAPVLNYNPGGPGVGKFRRYTFEDKLVTSLGAVYTYFQMVRGEFHEYGVSFGFDSTYNDAATNAPAGLGQSPFLRIKMNEGDAKAESWWHSAAFTHGGSTEANGGAGTHWEGDVKFTGTYNNTWTLHTNSTRVPNWNEDVRYFRIEAVDREITEATSAYVGTTKRDLRFSMYNNATSRDSGVGYRGWKYISQMTNIDNIDAVLDEIATGVISFSAWQLQYENWDERTYYENVMRAYHLESNIGYLA
jgi:hypothetical protein